MKKIFFALMFLFIFYTPVFGSFSGSSTIITENQTFSKKPGINNPLNVHEDYIINPFSGVNVQRNAAYQGGSLLYCYYTVNGVVFDSSSPLFISASDYNNSSSSRINESSNWIKTKIEYLENTYIQESGCGYAPNQSLKVRKYYRVLFSHDTSGPFCGDLELYNDKDLKEPFSYLGGWINNSKYYTFSCADPESGCKVEEGSTREVSETIPIINPERLSLENEQCIETQIGKATQCIQTGGIICGTGTGTVSDCTCTGTGSMMCTKKTLSSYTKTKVVSVPEKLGNNMLPTFEFKNNVNLTSYCTGALVGKDGKEINIMYDESFVEVNAFFQVNPAYTGSDLEFNREPNQIVEKMGGGKYYYSIVKEMNKKANTGTLSIELKDNTSELSMNGASGVHKYSVEVYRNELSNTSSDYRNRSYYKDGTFPPYNPDGKKTESDVKNIPLPDLSFTKTGKYKMIISAYDWAGNETKVTFKYTIYPTDDGLFDLSAWVGPTVGSTKFFDLRNNTPANEDKFANNSDNYNYTLTIRDKFGNPIPNKAINSLEHSCESFVGCSDITFDMIAHEGGNATVVYNTTKTDANGQLTFNLKSYTPGDFTETFKIQLNGWFENFTETSDRKFTGDVGSPSYKRTFKTPFNLKEILVSENDGKPIMGKQLTYDIKLEVVNRKITSVASGALEITRDSVKPISDGHVWNQTSSGFALKSPTNFALNGGNFTTGDTFKFSGIIGIGGSPNKALSQINVSTTSLPIKYELGGKKVRYPLNDVNLVGCESISTLGVKVIGTVQGSGINQSAGLEDNFSDLSKSETRAKIRQNAYTLTRNMTIGQIVNGVKYVVGRDAVISGELDYETLVVKDGNVIINGNLNPNRKTLGIIVLKDGYDVTKDYKTQGNVYVGTGVTEINAIIYADGALRSADESGNDYSDEELGNRLSIYGSLFTRNTIGGIIGGGIDMTLPGGQKTSDYELASKYDLNYVRKTPICSEDDYSVLIRYNPSVTTNPPKGFGSN